MKYNWPVSRDSLAEECVSTRSDLWLQSHLLWRMIRKWHKLLKINGKVRRCPLLRRILRNFPQRCIILEAATELVPTAGKSSPFHNESNTTLPHADAYSEERSLYKMMNTGHIEGLNVTKSPAYMATVSQAEMFSNTSWV